MARPCTDTPVHYEQTVRGCVARPCVMAQARCIKTSREVDCLRRANAASGAAHVAMWRASSAGMAGAGAAAAGVFEYELEAAFIGETMKRGMRHLGRGLHSSTFQLNLSRF